MSLNQVYGQENDVIVTKGLPGNDVLTGGLDNDVLTVGPGVDSYNCDPGQDIMKDFNKTKAVTTSKNCEPSEEPIDCNVILNVIKTLKDERNVLEEKLQSARTNLDPDLVAQNDSLNAEIASLEAQISNQEKLLDQCFPTPEPTGK